MTWAQTGLGVILLAHGFDPFQSLPSTGGSRRLPKGATVSLGGMASKGRIRTPRL